MFFSAESRERNRLISRACRDFVPGFLIPGVCARWFAGCSWLEFCLPVLIGEGECSGLEMVN